MKLLAYCKACNLVLGYLEDEAVLIDKCQNHTLTSRHKTILRDMDKQDNVKECKYSNYGGSTYSERNYMLHQYDFISYAFRQAMRDRKNRGY